MLPVILVGLLHSVAAFQSSSSSTIFPLEKTCGDGGKQSLHLNNPGIFIFNNTLRTKFSCHLELHLHSQSLGFSVFIETLKLPTAFNSDCKSDYIQFGRDKLFITTYTSEKYCERIEHTSDIRTETGQLINYNFGAVPYERREYVEDTDNEMDVWINLDSSHDKTNKEIKLIVVPFRKRCTGEDQRNYKMCPGSGRCFKREYFCSEMVKCEVLNDIEQRAACNKDAEGSHFFYLPIIIIVTVVIIIATVIIGFAVKTLAKHFHDNGVHHLDDSLRSPRICSPQRAGTASPGTGTALLTPEREQRRPDSQEIPMTSVPVKNTAPPSYEEVFGQICKDEPPQYQDIVDHNTTQPQSNDQ